MTGTSGWWPSSYEAVVSGDASALCLNNNFLIIIACEFRCNEVVIED